MFVSDNQQLMLVDIETSGLRPDRHGIVEVFAQRVDAKTFDVVGDPFNEVCFTAAEWQRWPMSTHKASGLLQEITESKQDETELYMKLAFWIERTFDTRDRAARPMCVGNSVHFDRSFLVTRGALDGHLNHRVLDASSIGAYLELTGVPWETPEDPEGHNPHRAKDDAMRSLRLLKAYREALSPSVPG